MLAFCFMNAFYSSFIKIHFVFPYVFRRTLSCRYRVTIEDSWSMRGYCWLQAHSTTSTLMSWASFSNDNTLVGLNVSYFDSQTQGTKQTKWGAPHAKSERLVWVAWAAGRARSACVASYVLLFFDLPTKTQTNGVLPQIDFIRLVSSKLIRREQHRTSTSATLPDCSL